MANGSGGVIADGEKLREVLSERGLPAKLEARLSPNERKVHAVLCATYDFASGSVSLEMPRYLMKQCGAEFAKLWEMSAPKPVANGKFAVTFTLTAAATKTTLRTVLAKDSGILKAKVNQVRLSRSWTQHLRSKPKAPAAAESVDWSKHEAAAKAHNAAVTEQILDGKTFNAQKDNPWARKNLKNWKNQQN